MSARRIRVVLALVFAIAALGCKHSRGAKQPGALAKTQDPVAEQQRPDLSEPWPVLSTDHLKLVPADTPYALVNAEPLPDEYLAALDPVVSPIVDVFRKALEGSTPSSEKERRLLEELTGRLNKAGLAELGIDVNPRFVLYGIGLAPVLRIRLADAKKYTAFLERVDDTKRENFHGLAMTAYRGKANDTVVTAVVGPDLVVAVMPRALEDEVLPLAFGMRLPAHNLAETQWVERAQADYGLTPHWISRIDIERLVTDLLSTSKTVAYKVARAWGVSPKQPSPECAAEIVQLAKNVPRIVGGFDQLSGAAVKTSFHLEMSPRWREPLTRMVGPIPGLKNGDKDKAVMVAGLGFDLGAALAEARKIAAQIQRQPYRCSVLSGLNEAAAMQLQGLTGVPPEVDNFTGISALVKSLEPGAKKAEVIGVVGVRDPGALIDAIARQFPMFDAAAIKGRRGAIPVAKLGIWGDSPPEDLKEVYVAVGRRSAGAAMGKSMRRRLVNALDRERTDNSFFYASMDMQAARKFAADDAEDLSPQARKIAEGMWAVLGRISMTMRFVPSGLELESSMRLPKKRKQKK